MSAVVTTPSDLVSLQNQIDSNTARIAAIPPPFDPTLINQTLISHESRISKLEGGIVVPPVNQAPFWDAIPDIVFKAGVAGNISIDQYAHDPNLDPLTITLNSIALPAGVSFDGKKFIYDGLGATGSTSGHFLTADDGKP